MLAAAEKIDLMVDAQKANVALQTGNVVFLDIRDPAAYQEVHIPGAINVNEIFSYLGTSDTNGKEEMKNFFEKILRKAGINGNEHIITYEDCLKTRLDLARAAEDITSFLSLAIRTLVSLMADGRLGSKLDSQLLRKSLK